MKQQWSKTNAAEYEAWEAAVFNPCICVWEFSKNVTLSCAFFS
jgi:hypothetical protein